MSREKSIYKDFKAEYVPGIGIMRDMGDTVPADATAGYGTGCIFQHTDGSAGSAFYVNVGSNTSCDFDAVDEGALLAAGIDLADAYANYTGTTVEAALQEIGGLAYTGRFAVTETLQGAAAATAANYGKFFVAPRACKVTKILEVHTTAGTDGGAVTLSVERLQGTEAPGAGDDLLGGTKINLKGLAETVQSPTLTTTGAHLVLAAGDRLGLKDTGTLTSLAGVAVTVELEWVVADNS